MKRQQTVRGGSSKIARRPGRPRANGQSSEDTRTEILKAAARVFSTKGVAGARMADIAAEVGVRPPSIYYHFKDLNEIKRILVNQPMFDASEFKKNSEEFPTPTKRLSGLICQMMEGLNNADIDIWFVTETPHLNVSQFPELGRKSKRWRDVVTRIYKEGAATGEFLSFDSKLAVSTIVGILFGAYYHNHMNNKPVDPSELADICLLAWGSRQGSP